MGEDFEIDERPLDVYRGDAHASPPPEAKSGGAGLPGLGRDLVTILADMVQRETALCAEIAKIKTAAPKDDEFGQFAKQALAFLDALDRIVELGKDPNLSEEIRAWMKSVEAAHSRILRLFEKFGMQQVECLGQEVDLDAHEVVEYRPTKEHPHNTIIKEAQKGFTLRGRRLRDARVVVACNEEN